MVFNLNRLFHVKHFQSPLTPLYKRGEFKAVGCVSTHPLWKISSPLHAQDLYPTLHLLTSLRGHVPICFAACGTCPRKTPALRSNSCLCGRRGPEKISNSRSKNLIFPLRKVSKGGMGGFDGLEGADLATRIFPTEHLSRIN